MKGAKSKGGGFHSGSSVSEKMETQSCPPSRHGATRWPSSSVIRDRRITKAHERPSDGCHGGILASDAQVCTIPAPPRVRKGHIPFKGVQGATRALLGWEEPTHRGRGRQDCAGTVLHAGSRAAGWWAAWGVPIHPCLRPLWHSRGCPPLSHCVVPNGSCCWLADTERHVRRVPNLA